MRRRPFAITTVVVVIGATALAGCGSSGVSERAQAVRTPNDDVSFNNCEEVTCEGKIGDAAYEIKLPEKWNGTLLLWSHGYRQAEPAPPDFDAVNTAAEYGPNDEVAATLLGQGYALAGSAYAKNGFAVSDGVEAGNALYEFFAKEVGTPDRTYVWGFSLGGLITAVMAEKYASEWVDGAAPLCGAVAGGPLNLDMGTDIAYAIKTLIYPDLKITGFASWDDAVQNWEAATKAVLAASTDLTTGVPSLILAGALVDAPTKTERYDGSTPQSQISAVVQTLLTGLGFATFSRQEIEERFGGNPSGNEGVDYGLRVDETEADLINTVSPGVLPSLLKKLADGERYPTDQAARDKMAAAGNPTGDIKVNTLTMHTGYDPLVVVQNETVYFDRVNRSKERTGDLRQLFTVPPATFAAPAPYGAGHCVFSNDELIGSIQILNEWVVANRYPNDATVKVQLGSDTGWSAAFNPGPWPNPQAKDT